jgi:hypothetical protein
MASYYNSSLTPYNLDGTPSYNPASLERSNEEPMNMAPLAIMPPPSGGSSHGNSLKSTASSRPPLTGGKVKMLAPRRPTTGALGIKRTNTNIAGPSKRPTAALSGSTSSYHIALESPSHFLVGVDMPHGGRGKGVVRNLGKTPTPSSTKTSSGTPLRIPRKNNRAAPNVFESKSEVPPPRTPSLTFLKGRVDALYEMVAKLENKIETRDINKAYLEQQAQSYRLSFLTKLTRVAKAANVAHAMNLPK